MTKRTTTQVKRKRQGDAITRRAKGSDKPALYGVIRRVADLETGEDLGAIVPMTVWDRSELRARGYHVNDEVRFVIEKGRNPKFHRLVHAIGGMMREHCDGFEHLTAHQVLKRLQLEANAFCETEVIDATPVVSMMLALVRGLWGPDHERELAEVLPSPVTITIKKAQSLAYDSMDEAAFQRFAHTIFDWMGREYFGGMEPERVALLVEAFELNHNG